MAMMKDLAPGAAQCKPGEEPKLKAAQPAVAEAAITLKPILQSSGAHKS
jgi:hypothetical protein